MRGPRRRGTLARLLPQTPTATRLENGDQFTAGAAPADEEADIVTGEVGVAAVQANPEAR
jgi:hypothetical protein